MVKKTVQIWILLAYLTLSGDAGAAKYSGDPFSLGVGGRALAMGGAVIAGPFDASTAYWNPAGLNRLHGRNILAMHGETFGSLLNHDYISYIDARKRTGSLVKSFGFYLYYLGGGGIKITDLDQNNRPFVVREESHGDYLLAASLAGELHPKLDFGLTAKIIYRDLGTETGKGLTVDAGMLYRASSVLDLGLMISDVTSGFIRYSGETFGDGANTESIYPTVKPGLMLKKTYHSFTGRLTASGDMKFEGIRSAAQYWSGSVSLDSHFGGEIGYQEQLFVRSGFDIGRFTAGGGIDIRNITVDFAYLQHSRLDETFRVSAGYRF